MAALFRTLALYLVTEKCYETYFYENNFFDGEFYLSISDMTINQLLKYNKYNECVTTKTRILIKFFIHVFFSYSIHS